MHDTVKKLISSGFEIGVHGIDAWHDIELARQELLRINDVTGRSDIGIRSHWLCFDNNSPQILEQAGFSYDSTFGYNDAVGYRAGSSQLFKPIGVKNILELPLHIQDTALFNSKRMNLPETEAEELCRKMIKTASTYGGALTILWHQRSLGPERLLEEFYIKLIAELKARNVWFATAIQAVNWTIKRRAVTFEKAEFNNNILTIKLKNNVHDIYPELLLRIFHTDCKELEFKNATIKPKNFIEIPLKDETIFNIDLRNISYEN